MSSLISNLHLEESCCPAWESQTPENSCCEGSLLWGSAAPGLHREWDSSWEGQCRAGSGIALLRAVLGFFRSLQTKSGVI